ncbi:hypothetical protein Bbelb_216590, partial [Branchiostoma belcheri]
MDVFFCADDAGIRADEEGIHADDEVFCVQAWKVFVQTRKVFKQTRKFCVCSRGRYSRRRESFLCADVEGIRAGVEGIHADEEVFCVQAWKVFAQAWKVFTQTRKFFVCRRGRYSRRRGRYSRRRGSFLCADEEGIRAGVEGIRADKEGIRADENFFVCAGVEGTRAYEEGIHADEVFLGAGVEGIRTDEEVFLCADVEAGTEYTTSVVTGDGGGNNVATTTETQRTTANLCDPHPCDTNAACRLLWGTVLCMCDEGYFGDAANLCDPHPCDTNAACRLLWGTVLCMCDEGYFGDGFTCSTDTVHSSPECIVNEPRGHRKYDHLGQAGLQGSRNAGIDVGQRNACGHSAYLWTGIRLPSSQGGTDLRPEFSDYKPGNQSQRVSLEVFSDPIRETRRPSSQGGTDLRPEFRDYKPGNQSQRGNTAVCFTTTRASFQFCVVVQMGTFHVLLTAWQSLEAANLCDPHPCDTNAACRLLWGTVLCMCDEGYFGDGFTCSVSPTPTTDSNPIKITPEPKLSSTIMQTTLEPSTDLKMIRTMDNVATTTETQRTTANLCDPHPCDTNAACRLLWGTVLCMCDEGYFGDVLTVPTNGSLSPVGSNTYQDVVTFSCDQGYELDGSTSVTCQVDGTWSGNIPHCNAIQCAARQAPANGAVRPTGAVSYPNGVTFTCNPGYVLNGVATPMCQADGTWSHTDPTCPPNGAISTTATPYQTVVNFTCNPGYVLNGTTNTTCQADGTWSNLVPTCRVRQCPTLTAPANGALSTTATSYQTVVNFTCNPGYVLNGTTNTTCQADGTWSNLVPTCRANGALSTTATSYQTVVNFTCNPGYVLNGTTNTTCQADGTWSNLVPTCTSIQCPILTAPANGALSTTATSYQTVVNFTCNPGYVLNGTTNTTCQADGTWSNLVPTCRVRQCPTLTAPANGALSTTATSYQTVVNFTCNPGYVLNGTTNTTCQADGTWSNLVPTCTSIQCPILTAPANGALSTTATSYPTVVNFTCNPGYVLNGTTNTTCQADGTWSNLVPTCRVRQCPTLTAPANGALSTTTTSYRTVVNFTCNPGYVLNGTSNTTCQADGTWSNLVPTCTASGALSTTATFYQTVVNFTCNTGYVLNGTTNRTCQADGAWSNLVPTCRVRQCPTLTAPTDGALSTTATSYQTVVNFTCNPGYVLNGTTNTTCQADGTWSNLVPTCRVRQCPTLTAPSNGALSTTATSYQIVVNFTCNLGYVLNGTTNTTCQADGTWSNLVPTCRVRQCPTLTAPANGALSTTATSYQTVVNFTCNPGYVLNGITNTTCQADGTWSNPIPTCRANGALSTTATSYQTVVNFTCNQGYRLDGVSSATCQADGTWSNPVPTCRANGALSTTATSYQTVVNFTCNPGYVLNGTTNTTCQADGTWSNLVPTCTVRQCPTLTALANGVLSTTATSYQTVVNFTCNPGYRLDRVSNATCQADGTWSNPVPTCIANGALSTTATSYQTVVNFTCNQGYRLDGASSATCQADGTWSNPVSTCRVRQCPTLTVPTNGALSTTATSYQTVVTFTCNTGYVLNGTPDTTCEADGIWSNPVPTCTPVKCPLLSPPTNGSLSPGGAETYLDVVTFSCDHGYDLDGSTSATCQGDGTWSANVPTCNAPPNGSLSPVGSNTYLDVVTFSCDQGYELDGSTSVTCQGDGTWSASVPECNDVDACLVRPCVTEATCTDNPAPALDATCTCNTGYTGDVYTASTISPPVTCQTPCHARATCQDVGSNPNCQCNTGWAGNGISCFDIDECRRKPFPCNKARETCLNTAGSYRCGCRPWLIRFQGNCKALHRFYVRLVYNASYDYEPEKHAPGGVQYEQSKREHLRHLNYMIDSIPEITRFGNPGFRRFERGSLVTFQSVTLLEGEMPLQPKTLEEHLQTYMKQNEQNSSFTFAGTTVAVTDLNECVENRATCPQGSTCVNTPGGYGCTYCSPEVAIIRGGMSIPRSRAFRLTSRFSVGVNCTEQFDITYRWEALPSAGTHWQELSDIVITAADIVSTKADLLVPSRTLNYGTYLFRLTVTVNETNTGITVSRTSNSASVSITASSLIAGILGGFRRQVGTGKVTLDAATLSSDPDGVIPMSKDLNYRWSCTPTDGRDEGLLTVNLGLETLHKELTFTVEVSAPGRDAVSASQIVEVVRSTIPLTSIICDRTYGTCGPKINAGEKMRLFLECSNCRAGLNAYTYRWTLVQRTQGSVTTWTDQDWNRNILNDRNQDYLTFRAGVFDKDGAYTVTAMVTDSNSTESGSSEYSFTLNEPPSVGTCAVHASDTSEGSFEIQCQGFYDSDLPLRYDFEYTPADVTVASVNSTDDSSNQLLLYSGPASSTPPIRLPTGNPDRNYELEIVIRVADALGAFANTSVITNTTSSITSVASVLNVANGSDVEDTTRIE